tara:strand:+ start:159 stop:356 length:198 start_codon:yes stop_codon:yes gene_type:complete
MWINVGKCLKNAQARKGLSNLELAAKVKKSPQQICRWRNQPDLKVQTVQSLCVALDMDIKEFLML